MKGPAVGLAFLLLLLDLVLGQSFYGMSPDELLRGTSARSGGSRRAVVRQRGARLPLYMMQLYWTMMTEDRVRTPAVNVNETDNEEDIPRVQDSDSVVNLVAKSCQQIGDRWSITFDMSSMSARDNIQLAELRIRLPAFTESSNASVDVYHSQQPDSRQLVGRLTAHPSSMVSPSSWRVFNMSDMLSRWLQQEYKNESMEMQEAELEEEQEVSQHPTADRVMMVVFSRQNSQQLIRLAEHSKYVSSDGERGTATTGLRSRKGKRQRRHRRAGDAFQAEEENKDSLCRKVDMWVDFEKLGWNEWSVYPKRYNAYRCEGRCPTPVDETYSPTNHAYMQSLLRLRHPNKASCLSCVPTQTSPLSMLYYENGKMVMRHHEDMLVEECGCH